MIQIHEQIAKKPIMTGSKIVIWPTLPNKVPDYLHNTNVEGLLVLIYVCTWPQVFANSG